MASYLAKANPDRYDLDCFLDGPTNRTLWIVCKDAELKDILYLAKCGKNAGIVAVARIAKGPKMQKDDIGDPCWTKLGKASPTARESRWRAEIEILPLKINISESELERYPVLKNKLTWLHGQGTCCHLSEEEEDAIQALIKR